MQSSKELQSVQSGNPALDLQRDQGLILARRHHPHYSDSSVSILCSVHDIHVDGIFMSN